MTTLQKTDFIKFNVSPTFKTLAAQKAKEKGMTLSELGRMLFGAYVSDIITTSPSERFVGLAQKAKEEYRKGKIKPFTDVDDAISYLHKLK